MPDPRTHICRRGEDIVKLSLEYPEVAWSDLEKAIEEAGIEDPYLLPEGEKLVLPIREPKNEAAATEEVHPFNTGPPEFTLNLRALDEMGAPIAKANYTLQIEGEEEARTGQTDDKGQILETKPLPREAARAVLEVELPPPGDDEEDCAQGPPFLRWEIELSSLHPLRKKDDGSAYVIGVQQRLSNLGFYSEESDGKLNEKTVEAVQTFKMEYGLEDNGSDPLDAPFLDKLYEVHDKKDSIVERANEEPEEES